VFDESRTQPVQRIYHLQTQVRALIVAMDALHDPLMRLIRMHRARWDPELDAEMHEAVEQLVRTVGRARSLADLLTSAHSANLAQVSLHQNEDMRKISAWVAIAAVPTMVAGIYGMNFENMPELGSRFGYPVVIAGILLACGLLHRTFRKAGWL
jgi:magnesium transporter